MSLTTKVILLDNIGQSVSTGRQVLIQLHSGNFTDFAAVRSDGNDIRFTDSSNVAIPYWRKTWDYANSFAEFYVKVNLTANTTDTINLLYGDNATPSLSSYSSTMSKMAYADTSYLHQWAFDEGSGSTVSDAVSSISATLVGTPTWQGADGGNCAGTNVTFATGSHILTNGTTQYITCSTALNVVPNNGTLAFWFKWAANPSGYASTDLYLVTKFNTINNSLSFYRDNTNSLYKFKITSDGVDFVCLTPITTFDNTNWQYIELQWGQLGMKILKNGSEVTSNYYYGKWKNYSGGSVLTFCAYKDTSVTNKFINAYIDGITVQSKQRSIGESISNYGRLKYYQNKVKTTLIRSENNPILAPSTEFATSCSAVFEPTAILSTDTSTVYLFYTAYNATNNYYVIHKAHTSVLDFPSNWVKDGPMLGHSTGGETNDASFGNIIKDGSTWYLFYSDNTNIRYISSTNDGVSWTSPTTVIAAASLPTDGVQATKSRIVVKNNIYYLLADVTYLSGVTRITLWTANAVTGPYTYQRELTGLQPGMGTDYYSVGAIQNVFGTFHIIYEGVTGGGGSPVTLHHAYSIDILNDSWTKEGQVLAPLGSFPEYSQVANTSFIEVNSTAYVLYDGKNTTNTYESWINILETNTTLAQLFAGTGVAANYQTNLTDVSLAGSIVDNVNMAGNLTIENSSDLSGSIVASTYLSGELKTSGGSSLLSGGSSCLKICPNNLLESGSLISSSVATSQVATLPVTNLLNSRKSSVWRSTTAASEQKLRFDFTSNQDVNMIALCYTNLSEGAMLRVYLYTNIADASPVYTSELTNVFGNTISNQAIAPSQVSYSHGKGTQGVIYFPSTLIRRIDIGISDVGNADGYLQVGTCIVGKYWSPPLSFMRGQTFQILDDGKHSRTESSDLLTDSYTKYRKFGFSMGLLDDANRAILTNILRSNGVTVPLYISLFSENTDKTLEDMYSMHGKLETLNVIDNPTLGRYVNNISFIEL